MEPTKKSLAQKTKLIAAMMTMIGLTVGLAIGFVLGFIFCAWLYTDIPVS